MDHHLFAADSLIAGTDRSEKIILGAGRLGERARHALQPDLLLYVQCPNERTNPGGVRRRGAPRGNHVRVAGAVLAAETLLGNQAHTLRELLSRVNRLSHLQSSFHRLYQEGCQGTGRVRSRGVVQSLNKGGTGGGTHAALLQKFTTGTGAGVRRSRVAALLLVPLAAIMLLCAGNTVEVFNSPAGITAIGLYLAGLKKGVLSRMTSAPLQFLGTISYSLYLLHVPAILVSVSIALRLFDIGTLFGALAVFLSTIVGSLVAATVFWWAIERPSHRFAKRLKLKKKPVERVRTPASEELSPSTNP